MMLPAVALCGAAAGLCNDKQKVALRAKYQCGSQLALG